MPFRNRRAAPVQPGPSSTVPSNHIPSSPVPSRPVPCRSITSRPVPCRPVPQMQSVSQSISQSNSHAVSQSVNPVLGSRCCRMVCRVGFIFWEGIAKQGPISCISPGCISPGCISPGTVQETAASAPAASDTVQLPQRLHQPNDLIHFSHPLTGMMSTTRSKSLVLVSCPKQNTMSRRR